MVDNFDLSAHINIGGTNTIDLTVEMDPTYRRQIIQPDQSITVPIVGMYHSFTRYNTSANRWFCLRHYLVKVMQGLTLQIHIETFFLFIYVSKILTPTHSGDKT